MVLRQITRAIVKPFGYTTVKSGRGFRIQKKHDGEMVYLHRYAGGYEEYRQTQIHHNKRKLDQVWADEGTLRAIVDDLKRHVPEPKRGLCHGARNGWEVQALGRLTGAEMLGTDISETATQFPNMVVWDFHEENPDWAGRFDFIYTNSLDQAMEPDRALRSWSKQLAPGGRIYIEHTMAHSPQGASEMDPFGAHPMCMPYLLFKWGQGHFRLAGIMELGPKSNKGLDVWVFVLIADPVAA